MKKWFLKLVLLFVIFSGLLSDTFGLISPIRRSRYEKPLLTNCNDIQLISLWVDLYHHPLGIWLVHCRGQFKNLYPKRIQQEMAFNSGFDIEVIETELVCNEFNNFQILADGREVKNVRMKEQCQNYVERIGMEWTNDDRTGIGFVNTWKLDFEPEQVRTIDISFNFVVKKPPENFKSMIREHWYQELMSWLKHEHLKRKENDFKLPLNMGSFWALSMDTIRVRTHLSRQWLGMEDWGNVQYLPENILLLTYTRPIDFYSPPAVDLAPLTEEDLKDRSDTELALLRNSFFAKYGRKFDISWIMKYFSMQPWYYENENFDNWYLTEFDISNMKFIHQREKQ